MAWLLTFCCLFPAIETAGDPGEDGFIQRQHVHARDGAPWESYGFTWVAGLRAEASAEYALCKPSSRPSSRSRQHGASRWKGADSYDTVRSVACIHPNDYIDVALNPTGVVFGLRSSEIFWFNDAKDLVQFLCLDGETYITALSAERKTPIAAALRQRLDRSLELLGGGEGNLGEAVCQLQECYDGRVPLRWYGRFSTLCQSDAEVPQLLRSMFFKSRGLPARTRKEDMDDYDFAQFLIEDW